MIKYLENEKLEDILGDDLTIVDFYADWCGPCKMVSREFEDLLKEKDVKIIKINVDTHEELSREFGVMSIPTILFYLNKTMMKRHVGFIDKEEIVKSITTITQ